MKAGKQMNLVFVLNNINRYGGKFDTQFRGGKEDSLGTGQPVVGVQNQFHFENVVHLQNFGVSNYLKEIKD
jgi:hypothetical protein